MLLPILILASLAYLVFAIANIVEETRRGAWKEASHFHPAGRYLFGGGVPLGVAATMTYLFLVVGGATTVQFNVGNPSAMNVWSTWVDLWPIFLWMTAANTGGCLIWVIVCAAKKTMRASLPASATSCLLSALSFFTVLSYFPSA
jgi:hypothetical protein